MPHGKPADQKAIQLFARLRDIGFSTCLLSNNNKRRVEPFARDVGSDYICMAFKPKRDGYYQAMKIMGTKTDNTIFIGDQLFTDVWGAKRIGMRNILTAPINPVEEIQIVLKRFLEKIVLKKWEREKKEKKKKKGGRA